MSHLRRVNSVVGVLALVSSARAAVIHVDVTAPDGGDGSSWTLAFNDLRDAIAATAPADQLWVAAGTYKPARPGGSRSWSFALPSGVEVYGGFAGHEASLDERDPAANPTTLSGDLNGDDAPEFVGMGENSVHVVKAGAGSARLDGFVVTGGNMNVGHTGGGGGVYLTSGSLTIANCTFTRNRTHVHGGAVFADDAGELRVEACTFNDSVAGVGGHLVAIELLGVALTDSTFTGGLALGGGAAAFIFDAGDISIARCVFRENTTAIDAALIGEGTSLEIRDCIFSGNLGGFLASALAFAAEQNPTRIVNCAFSRNYVAALGHGTIYAAGDAELVGCTFSDNVGAGLVADGGSGSTTIGIVNSVFWGNTDGQVIDDPALPGAVYDVTFSDIEGGFSGSGNIDADPLFVQPGTDDLRLGIGSPCLNAGSNGAVPRDVDSDIAGNPRIQEGVVDMGAYEGAFDALPPAAMVSDLDPGDFAILVPDGAGFDPLANTTLVVRNVSGPSDATMLVTLSDLQPHPFALGFSSLARALTVETGLGDGELFQTVYFPFELDDLGGADPHDLDVTAFDPVTGNWGLAVAANNAPSPGHAGPIGDRLVAASGGVFAPSIDLGDWGVYWDPSAQRGVAWANLDHVADLSFGVPLCPADARQAPNGIVDVRDLVSVLSEWGAGDGPFDVDGDGTVGLGDVAAILGAWGACPAG